MERNEGPCIGGPLDGLKFGCPKDNFWIEYHRLDSSGASEAARSVYLWRDGQWIWEHHQERDDLPADRN